MADAAPAAAAADGLLSHLSLSPIVRSMMAKPSILLIRASMRTILTNRVTLLRCSPAPARAKQISAGHDLPDE